MVVVGGSLKFKIPSRVSNNTLGQKSVAVVVLMVVLAPTSVAAQVLPGCVEGLSRMRSKRMMASGWPLRQVTGAGAPVDVDVKEPTSVVGKAGSVGGTTPEVGFAFLPT